MTMREFYQNVLNTCGTTVSPWGEDEEQIVDICHKQIAALDARNEHRKSADSKEKRESAARRELVLGFLQAHANEVFTRDQIAEAVHISVGQVTAACKGLGDAVTKTEAKVDKVRKVVYQYNG